MTIYVLSCGVANASIDFVDVKVTPATREYCHMVRFPHGWKIKGPDYNREPLYIDYNQSDYEFRAEGLQGTWFLVGVIKADVVRYDAANWYRVNLSDATAPVRPVSRKDWEAAAVVPLSRKSIVPYSLGMTTQSWYDYQAVFNGFKFTKSGSRWAYSEHASRLSPDSAWVVLQSKTEEAKSGFLPVYHVFFDVYSTETGRKALTIEGRYTGLDDPDSCLKRTAWLTKRYFIIPSGRSRERCLVCEFSGH